jgi:glycosyltransferase involved in cell wall biosynthesis
MQSDLVSVIIPAYNAEKYIVDCLNSIFNQTYKNIQVIVVNDGSTDDTEVLLTNLLDPRLEIIRQENRGASHAKNKGLENAKGCYIQYLDADDILSPDKIEKQILTIKSKKNTVAVCKTLVFVDDIENWTNEIDTDIINGTHTGLNFYKNILGAKGRIAMVQPNAYLIPRTIIEKSGPWLTEFYPCPDEDGEYFSRILLNTEEVIFTQGINYYRKNLNDLSLSRSYSLSRATNQLLTTERKCLNLISIDSSINSKKLLLYNISLVVYQFSSEYPEIIKQATLIIRNHGFKKFKLLGNIKFNFLSSLLGTKSTLLILNFYRKTKFA